MIENNKEEFDVLTFQFEMLGVDEIARDVSSKLDKSVKEIYSVGAKLSQEELSEINTVLDTLQNYPIFVVDNTGTRLEIKDTIIHYINQNKLIERKKRFSCYTRPYTSRKNNRG